MVEMLITLMTPILPTLLVLIGGQRILDHYAYIRKQREQEVELIAAIREQQYKTLAELYEIFAKFMTFYRVINAEFTDLQDKDIQIGLFKDIAYTEAKLDAIILKIGCEFADAKDDKPQLEAILGDLRQSVQLWRESVGRGKKLPFDSSEQKDYMRFKSAFARTSAFMINQIHERLEAPQANMQRVEELLVGSFDNKYEKWEWADFTTGEYTG